MCPGVAEVLGDAMEPRVNAARKSESSEGPCMSEKSRPGTKMSRFSVGWSGIGQVQHY